MINYALACENGHEFDGWFRNSGDYDKQKKMGLVTCPFCDNSAVQKRLMAPNVSTSRTQKKAKAEQQVAQAVAAAQSKTAGTETTAATSGSSIVSSNEEQTVAAPSPATDLQIVPEKARELVEALREFRKQVVANSDYVGDKFAEEARKIHYGESEERGIYGETTPDDAKELLEEGIELMPLPVLPEDRN